MEVVKKPGVIVALVVGVLAVLIIGWAVIPSAKQAEIVYETEYNDLHVEIGEIGLTEHEDTGKVIANIPVTLTNDSDHAFIFQMPHFFYNGDEKVSAIFDVDDADKVAGKIKRGTTKEGTLQVTLKTRDIDSVKTIDPTFSISDMKTEEETDLTPQIEVVAP